MKLFSLTLVSVVCCFLCCCDATAYTVLTLTGPERYGGTSGKVYITLKGSIGNSSKILLDHKNKPPFQRGQADTFNITTPDIGIVTEIRIELQGNPTQWQLLAVSLSDDTRQFGTWFPLNNWLSTSEKEKTMSVDIPEHTRPPYTVYQVIVKTGNERDAGTFGKVYITLYGWTGNSSKILLDHEGKPEFQRGQTDTFILKIDDIETVSKIRVELDSTRNNKSPNWHLMEVSIRDLKRQQSQWFPWNKWFKPTNRLKIISTMISPKTH